MAFKRAAASNQISGSPLGIYVSITEGVYVHHRGAGADAKKSCHNSELGELHREVVRLRVLLESCLIVMMILDSLVFTLSAVKKRALSKREVGNL